MCKDVKIAEEQLTKAMNAGYQKMTVRQLSFQVQQYAAYRIVLVYISISVLKTFGIVIIV